MYNNLGVVLLGQGILDRAIGYLEQALELYPEHLNAVYNLGMALWASGRTSEAVDRYRQTLQMKPDWGVAANSLAWILATDRNDQIRNGQEAVRWALVACEGTGAGNPEYLDTLAAAYAEAGQFDNAVQTAQKCIELSDAGKDSAFREEVGRRLRLYQEHEALSEIGQDTRDKTSAPEKGNTIQREYLKRSGASGQILENLFIRKMWMS